MENQSGKQLEFFEKSAIPNTYIVCRKPVTLEEAWRMTFEKWTLKIYGYNLTTTTMYEHTCGLCSLFFYEKCDGCPIADAGYEGCENREFQEYLFTPSNDNAKAEMEFLKRIFEKSNNIKEQNNASSNDVQNNERT